MPPGLVADTIDGAAFVSLVAFDFLDTRVLGIKWPGFINFPEINLRFYVKRGEERGVVFIRELVPQFVVATLAKLFYNEPYQSCPMKSFKRIVDGTIQVEHQIQYADNKYGIKLSAKDSAYLPDESGIEHFFKEHSWGYGKTHDNKLIRYHVDHQIWKIYPVLAHELTWDFGAIYGSEFTFLNNEKPYSIVFAEGSSVAVYPRNA